MRALPPWTDSAPDAKDSPATHHSLPQPQNGPPLPEGEERGEGVRNSGNSPAVKFPRATPFRSPQVHPRSLQWTGQIQSGVARRPFFPLRLPPHSKIPRAFIFETPYVVTYVCFCAFLMANGAIPGQNAAHENHDESMAGRNGGDCPYSVMLYSADGSV